MTRAILSAGRASREMRFLCACVGASREPGRLARALAEGPVEWAKVLALAANHHAIPLAYQAMKAIARGRAGAVPAEFLAYLHREYMAIAACNLRATATLHRLQRRMEADGIRLVPIKGPALALLAYGSTSMRQFEDLDLIVRREDLLRAVDRLEREGYELREIPPGASRPRHLAALQDWSLRKPGEPLHVDLKPVLISHTLSGPESADFMARACRPLAMGEGRSLLAPGPEAMLWAVCLDGANEMWGKLSSVADVARLLAAFPDAEWSGLLREAAHVGQRRSLLSGARLASLLLESPVPEAFQDAERRDPVARRLAEEAAGRMRAELSLRTGIVRQCGYALRTRDRARDRWRFLRRLLFVPGAAELNLLALPGVLHPLYSLLRPFRLAWDALRGRPRRIDAPAASGQP